MNAVAAELVSPRLVTPELLRGMPLPDPLASADKDSRGTVLVVGGSAMSLGAVTLAGEAAFRAGAGKVILSVPQTLSREVAVGFPEAGIHAFASTRKGDPQPRTATRQIRPLFPDVDVAIVGPGLANEFAAQQLTNGLLGANAGPAYVIDAMALTGLWRDPSALLAHRGKLVITPHAGEMARLTNCSKEDVAANPLRFAQDAANHLQCVVVLKGASTTIAQPSGPLFVHEGANPGLAMSGSGDVLAGVLGALMARGVSALNAALWSVYLHAQAGKALAQRIGTVGFLARELAAEIPMLMSTSLSDPSVTRPRIRGRPQPRPVPKS